MKEHEHDHGHATFIFPKDKNEATEIHIDEHNHSENVEHEDVAMLVENAEGIKCESINIFSQYCFETD